MGKRRNTALIGAFVVGAVVLVLAAVIALGGGKAFRRTVPIAMYFSESIKGLEVGAPVLWEGVKVGEVTDIQLVVTSPGGKVMSVVFAGLERGAIRGTEKQPLASGLGTRGAFARLQGFVDEGLRARLDLLSFLTGQLCISLGFHSGMPAERRGVNPDYFEIPTIPSLQGRLLSRIDKLPLTEVAQSLIGAAHAIEKASSSPEISEATTAARDALVAMRQTARDVGKDLPQLVAELRQLVDDLDTQIPPVAEEVRGTAADARRLINDVDGQVAPLAQQAAQTLQAARKAVAEAATALTHVADATAGDSELRVEFVRVLKDLAAAARSVQQLADYLDRHPEALIRGKGGD